MSDRLEDILADHLRVVFCGINPGKGSAALGLHFANRSNRFWRTLHLAGFTSHEIRPEDGPTLLRYGCGLTTVVERPTASVTRWRGMNSPMRRQRLNRRFAVAGRASWRFWASPATARCPASAR